MIRLETSTRTGIDNIQVHDISIYERRMNERIERKFSGRIEKRTDMSPLYNCHGLTFASRRTRVCDSIAVQSILRDDRWEEVSPEQVLPGDIVVYFDDDGDLNHSGIVVCNSPLRICSKWGSAGEFIHDLNEIPRDQYGPRWQFYRCRL